MRPQINCSIKSMWWYGRAAKWKHCTFPWGFRNFDFWWKPKIFHGRSAFFEKRTKTQTKT